MSWGRKSMMVVGALLLGAVTQAHAATVGIAFNNMAINLNPETMSDNYTGVISFSDRSGTSVSLGGWSPDFGGVMSSGFTISGALHFDSGNLDTSQTKSITVDAGNGDVLNLDFSLPASLTALPLNSFSLSIHVSGASVVDGNGDGYFGSIALPTAGYSYSGAGGAIGLGQQYKFSFYSRQINGGQIYTVLQSYGSDPTTDDVAGGAVTAPLPAAAWAGLSLLSGLGIVRARRKVA